MSEKSNNENNYNKNDESNTKNSKDSNNASNEHKEQHLDEPTKINRADFFKKLSKTSVTGIVTVGSLFVGNELLHSNTWCQCECGSCSCSCWSSDWSGQWSHWASDWVSDWKGDIWPNWSNWPQNWPQNWPKNWPQNWPQNWSGNYDNDPRNGESGPEIPDDQGVGKEPDPKGLDPVNMRTGNYGMSIADFSIPGINLNLDFIRTFNSRLTYYGPLGWGWTHNFNHRLYDNGTYVNYFKPNGAVIRFDLVSGNYVSPKGFRGTLTKSGSNFVINMLNRITYNFNSYGQLIGYYNNNGNTITINYANGRISNIIDTTGRTVAFAHNANNRISTITLPGGTVINYTYNSSNDLIKVTDSNGYEANYTYDSNHNMVGKEDPKMPAGYTYNTFEYDAQNRVVRMRDINNNEEGTITYQTNKAIETDAKGNSKTYEFDADGNFTRYTDQLGNVTQYGYDTNGNITSIINAKNKTISMTYDGNNNLTSITDPLNNTMSYTYNSFNKITGVTGPLGIIVALTYDAKDNLTGATDALGKSVGIIYNSKGQRTSITDKDGKTINFEYNVYGAVNKVIFPMGDEYRYESDIMGKITKVIDQSGNETNVTYENGRVKQIVYPDSTYTEYTYNAKGYLTAKRGSDGKTIDFTYNNKDMMTKTTLPDNSNQLFDFDANGNLTTITDRGGKEINHTYFNDDSIESVRNYVDLVQNFEYDKIGNVKKIIDAKGQTYNLLYDDAGRITNIDSFVLGYDDASRLTEMQDTLGTHQIIYNDRNEVTAINDPRGRSVSYGYSDSGMIKSIALSGAGGFGLNFEYDDNKRLTGISEGTSNITDLMYDSEGYLAKALYDNSTEQEFKYDRQNGVITAMRLFNSIPAPPPAEEEFIIRAMAVGYLNELNIQYDDGLKITQEKLDGVTKDYKYNSVNELIRVTKNSAVYEEYSYNLDGNRTSRIKEGIPTDYSYNGNNQLINETTEGVTTNYTYDANGNLIGKTDGADTYEYAYDIYNQLIEVKKNGITIQQNSYDGFGRRIRKVTDSGTINYFYNGNNVVLETDESGNVIASYQGSIIALNGVKYYPIYDLRRSIIKLVDTNGQVVAAYDYDAYGNIISNSNPAISNRYFFCSCEYDEETGLYHMGARYYDPQIGRFISTDPIGAMGGLNIYVYCSNDPVNFIDPLGLKVNKSAIFWGGVDVAFGLSEIGLAGASLTGSGGLATFPAICLAISGLTRFVLGSVKIIKGIQGESVQGMPGNLGGLIGWEIDNFIDQDKASDEVGKAQAIGELLNDLYSFAKTLQGLAKVLSNGLKNGLKAPQLAKIVKDIIELMSSLPSVPLSAEEFPKPYNLPKKIVGINELNSAVTE